MWQTPRRLNMSISYQIGNLAGRHKWGAGALLASVAIYLSLSTSAPAPSLDRHSQATSACDAPLLEQQASIATRYIKAGRHDKAIMLLSSCPENLRAGTPGNDLMGKANAELAKQEAAAYAAKLVKWKSAGVRIGMSAERVLLSDWGKPESVRKTTNRYGLSEQWSYGYNHYLYFENGVLTSIQQ